MISGIHLQPELKKAFEEMGFSEMTEIQKKSIPLIQQGRDVIGQSQTGSGKTAAFGFPILEKITHNNGLQALVLVPTRELCEQVMTEMRKFAKHKRMNINAIYGGVSINPQFGILRNADIIVGTPGRMLDHLERGTINLSKVKILVLDEADKMFEMGFVEDVQKIISQTPRDRQTLLFSATISKQVHEIVRNYMKNPEKIKTQEYVEESKMAQYFYSVGQRDKFSLLVHILKQESKDESRGLTIVFCATRNRVDVVGKNLYKQGVHAISLHGGLSQNRRKQSIDAFHRGEVDVLVASDVAARGLDIKNVSHVINYDSPKTSKEYIHRIGRTARAGEEGKVISLIAEPDHENFRNVLSDRSIAVEQLKLPEFEKISFVASSERGHFGHSGGFRGGYRGQSRGGGYQGGGRRGPYHSHNSGHSRSSESSGHSSDGEGQHSGPDSQNSYGHGRNYSGSRRGSYSSGRRFR